MEEGELEPEPEPEPGPESLPNPVSSSDEKTCRGVTEGNGKHDDGIPISCRNEENSAKKQAVESEEKMECDGFGANSIKEEGKVSDCVGAEADIATEAKDQQKESDSVLDEKISLEGDGREKENGVDSNDVVEGNLCEKKQELPEEVRLRESSQDLEERSGDEEHMVENEGKKSESPVSNSAKEDLEENQGEGKGVVTQTEAVREEETGAGLEIEEREIEERQGNDIDLEVEPEGAIDVFVSSKVVVGEKRSEDMTLNLMTGNPKDNEKDNCQPIVVSTKENYVEDGNAMEVQSRRGFELVFQSDLGRTEKAQCSGSVTDKQKNIKLKMESLDLSLSLPGILQDYTSKCPVPKSDSPTHTKSIQSLPSSFRTYSDGYTSSQPFVHNPSCSLTQNSFDNYEQSVGSRPIFQPVDQAAGGTIWQAQTSNESKRKAAPLVQRILQNGNAANHMFHSTNGQQQGKPNGILRQMSLPRQSSPAHSHGSHDSRSEHSKGKMQLTRERSSSSIFRSEKQEGEPLMLNGSGVIERIVAKIVSEPLHLSGRMLQEMTEPSIAYLKETICEMITSADKTGQITALQVALKRRSDLNVEMLPKCNRVLLEILVALKTGLPDFILKASSITISDLVDIFLDLKCCNLACRNMLPVDDCDCKVCMQKNGFCSACMCLVCSKFDMASNTCGWVGCDVCLHWCHTDCGLRHSLIKNGGSGPRAHGNNEMQFHCIACNHPSEMFGFVKEVFKTCAKDWKAETLTKELQYVRRIFSSSIDERGKRLRDVAQQMLVKLEDKAKHSEVIKYVMAFFSDSESNFSISPTKSRTIAEGSSMIPSSNEGPKWVPSGLSDRVANLENAGSLSSMEFKRAGGQIGNVKQQNDFEKKPVVDELDSVVKFKQAEAKMYQERADDARREAEGLKRIVLAKNIRIEEDYNSRIAKLRLGEAEERRKQKLEELQVIERAQRDYLDLKIRMETDIRDLLLKMEAAKRNFST
ncbi:protein OBERON 4 [Ananas comosus]|uniref:Protein OBERON 4 n=2 Tax=Ananas comosus TaxID=4615 RepID=A0A6P5G942_ANACO|nr:protein OBERON 4 [Ananas comosus]